MPDKMKILLVDDEPSIAKVVGKRLELAGYEVVVASDGQDGLQKAQTQAPDLVILDIMLPKLNGYEVCTMLKGDKRYQQIPIVMFSARGQDQDVETSKSCGADGYVMKPFSHGRILHRTNMEEAHSICAKVAILLERGVLVTEAPNETKEGTNG